MNPVTYAELTVRVAWCKLTGHHDLLPLDDAEAFKGDVSLGKLPDGAVVTCSHCGEMFIGTTRMLGKDPRRWTFGKWFRARWKLGWFRRWAGFFVGYTYASLTLHFNESYASVTVGERQIISILTGMALVLLEGFNDGEDKS